MPDAVEMGRMRGGQMQVSRRKGGQMMGCRP